MRQRRKEGGRGGRRGREEVGVREAGREEREGERGEEGGGKARRVAY